MKGTLKKFEYKDENKWAKIYDLKIGEEIEGDQFGEGFEGCLFKITGGSDKNGFAMKQGVATKNKIKLLLAEGTSGYRCKRDGVRKRKSVRGCIVGPEISSLNMVLLRKGEKELPGLTDTTNDLRLGPKRANKIRKLFNLPRHSDNRGVKDATKITVNNIDVCRAVVKRITKEVEGKKYYKAPKITRLLTSERIRRKKVKRALKLNRAQNNQRRMKQYQAQLTKKRNEEKLRKKSKVAK